MDKKPVVLAVLACLAPALGLAEAWSGTLVDSRCWGFAENNTKDVSIYVDRDRNLEISSCSPTAKTKSFAVVLSDGLTLKLDAAGDAKAAELVQQTGKASPITVGVTGEKNRNTIKADSISIMR
jgi:hypothetical protein